MTHQPASMSKLAKAETVVVPVTDRTTWRHVVLTSDDGRVGVGEYTLYAPSIDDMMRKRAASLLGFSAGDGLASTAAMPTTDLVEATVKSALDQALHDLVAQERCLPIARHLNREATGSSVALYANINRRTRDRSPDSVAASARKAVAAGFDAIKIAPFDDVSCANCESRDGQILVAAGLDRLRAAADAIDGAAELRVDCHWRFTTSRARQLIAETGALGVAWFECPIPETRDAVPDLRALRAIAADRGMRLAGCETMAGREGFAPFITGGCYDVIMPDVKHAGGLVEIIRITEDATAHGVGVSLHNPSGPVAHAHSVHAACALPGEEKLEFQFDESPLFMTITEPAPDLESGSARRTSAPGLGMRLAIPAAPADDPTAS